MSTSTRERLLKWLQDAYAMEQQADAMLTALAGRLEHYTSLRNRVLGHAAETRQQADDVRGCIERLGGAVPAARSMAASAAGSLQALGNALMSDEVVKGMGASYAFEYLEAATYRALVIAAEAAGETDIAEVCNRILQQELAMAEWLRANHGGIVQEFLQREPDAPGLARR
ncbi:ferritin-like domain-containing protein [Luteimonas sp. RD2P54]|uniref:Ferritin-like domain-containing protein n=1 Tax=Luteimonas endophytica TaxID=3042023 RepID=A0ABT6J8F0_9GAMM|nr:ferritin-like domain-containing protein [Luteimonas endophytica]MDH5823106.1 ferritin-like domain-containing protein [Luteimonas endophytica]